MNRPNPYINTFYLLVHFVLNLIVIAVVIDLLDTYVPFKRFIMGYHLNLHLFDVHITTMQRNLAIALVVGVAAVWYYQRKKHIDTNHLIDEFLKSIKRFF